MAEGPRDALVSRNSATTKHPISKLESRSYRGHYLRDPTFFFHTIPECDRQTHTHRQTDGRTDTPRRHVPRLAQRRAVKIDNIHCPPSIITRQSVG